MPNENLAPATTTHAVSLAVAALGVVLLLGTLIGYRILTPDMTTPRPAPGSAPVASNEKTGTALEAELMAHITTLMEKVQADPSDSESLTSLAGHFIQLQQWESAEKFASQAALNTPQDPQPQYLLSVALHGLKRNEEAAASLETAITLGDAPALRYSLGILYAYYLNDPQKAVLHFKKGLEGNELSNALKEDLRKELEKIGL